MKTFNVEKFGGMMQGRSSELTHDGVEYTHRAVFETDEEIDAFLDSIAEKHDFNVQATRDLENGRLILWWKV